MVLTIALYTLLGIVAAWSIYQVIHILKSRSTEAALKEAAELVSSGKTDAAIKDLETKVTNNYSEQTFLALLNLVLASGQYEKAVELIEKVKGMGKGSFSIEMMKGYSLFLASKFEDAIAVYQELLEAHPDKIDVINSNIASVYIEEDENLDKAEKIYLDILEKGKLKSTYNILINLGFAQMKQGKYEEAIINEKVALEQIPKEGDFSSLFALAHYVMGLSHYYLKKNDNAKEELKLAKRYSNSNEFNKKINQVLTTVNSDS